MNLNLNPSKIKIIYFRGIFPPAAAGGVLVYRLSNFTQSSMTGISSEADIVATISMGRNIDSNLTLILLMLFKLGEGMHRDSNLTLFSLNLP